MIRFIIWLILFFIIYTIIKIIRTAFASVKLDGNEKPKRKNNSKYIIKEEDIIEAKFEDISPKEKDNSKS